MYRTGGMKSFHFEIPCENPLMGINDSHLDCEYLLIAQYKNNILTSQKLQ